MSMRQTAKDIKHSLGLETELPLVYAKIQRHDQCSTITITCRAGGVADMAA
jgi:hypothetical protein